MQQLCMSIQNVQICAPKTAETRGHEPSRLCAPGTGA